MLREQRGVIVGIEFQPVRTIDAVAAAGARLHACEFLAAAATVVSLGPIRWCAADTVSLASLQLGNVQQSEGKAQADKSAGGNTISIGGQKFEHGVGVQAPSKMVLRLNGGATKFTATVGVDDEVKDKGAGVTVIMTVTGDSRRLWPPMAAGQVTGTM